MSEPPRRRVRSRTHRLIASRFPTVGVFDDIAESEEDARAAFELAVQHYAYCPALMDNLAPAMGALAATLFGRHWIFDWH